MKTRNVVTILDDNPTESLNSMGRFNNRAPHYTTVHYTTQHYTIGALRSARLPAHELQYEVSQRRLCLQHQARDKSL